jgi:hypothetical protein
VPGVVSAHRGVAHRGIDTWRCTRGDRRS